jgi:formate-nitrite transporter family protein
MLAIQRCETEPAMITGSHVILTSKDPDADRAFFRDVLNFASVDAGHGWLIFALPPAAENTLTVVLPLLLRKDLSTLLRMLRLWAVVLAANLVGTFLFALCVGRIGIFDARTQQILTQIGATHIGVGFGTVFVRSIFAGWLIALMVWLLPGAESARVSIIIIVTYLVGISGFDHIIAGSTATFFLLVRGSISWATYVVQFFLPTLMGNVIGGLSLVAALGHAQVVGGKEK